MLIDTGRLNPEEPIDVTQICNTKLFKLDPRKKQYGFQITDEVSFWEVNYNYCF